LAPVLVVAIARILAFAAFFAARRASADSTLTLAAAWTVALALPTFAAAFLVGLARWHVFVTTGVQAINARLREMPGPEEVQELLADAFDDPDLQIASWSNTRHRWIDAAGHPLNEPGIDTGRHLTEVRGGPPPAIAIVHDEALAGDSAFVESAATAASVAFASDRVAARTAGLIRELRASRARIVAAADSERRRIERDLHDGAQQHLVGLCIHLELAAEAAEQDHPADAAEFRRLVGEVEQALEEIRSLTHGIYPAMLLEGGLEVAVRSAARRSPIPATVEAKDLGEYPDEIIAAVYFCCAEALQNVAKHAREARSVRIALREANRVLSFSVADDGPGLVESEARVGAGMLNMRDRMATVGGKLTVQSRPGQGTRISGRIPLAAIDRPERPHGDGRASPRPRAPRRREHKGS
jgi:signal transduction histidine kinase